MQMQEVQHSTENQKQREKLRWMTNQLNKSVPLNTYDIFLILIILMILYKNK